MKKIYAAAAQKKVADSLLSIAETQIRELENAVILLGNKDEELKRGYTNQISILNDEIILYKDQIKGFEKLLRKEKRKTGLAILSGIMTTTIMTALFLVNN